MLFTREIAVAIDILQYLHGNEGWHSINALTAALDESRPMVRDALMRLSAEGFVNSKKGRTGGYTWAKGAEALDLQFFMGRFGREYTPNLLYGKNRASERVMVRLSNWMGRTKLGDVL